MQGHADNPKDDPSWRIYPPPPPPTWLEDPPQKPFDCDVNEVSATERSFWAGSSDRYGGRKPGHDIGEDFVFDDCDIPEENEMEFRLDEKGVYQVYENKKGILRLAMAS